MENMPGMRRRKKMENMPGMLRRKKVENMPGMCRRKKSGKHARKSSKYSFARKRRSVTLDSAPSNKAY
jgi:hypothetical protein